MKKYSNILADERPEFKAANYGFDTLSNTELLSMVINRGAGTTESLSQARQLMNIADGSLSNLAKLSMDEMQVVQGIGDCKALAVLAAIELGKRRALERMPTKPDLGSSLAIYNYMLPQMADLKVEQAHAIFMNQNFRLIKSVKLSQGGITETSVDIRILMREAVMSGATIMAFVHNHPSGNTQPSKADDVLTQQIAKASQIMRIFFMDHVIVTDGSFYSYHDKGRL
ncbi:DNA repair protein RadC [Segatella copri]|uniref:JAB domain-containing protein n=1 Tax=Segatella copri TaxID=165179 RepID=UPI00294AEEED|nr:DNA repair protein RadC [Segatella copri]WOG04204.1 DNA repair protein RadC [Segatella copri]